MPCGRSLQVQQDFTPKVLEKRIPLKGKVAVNQARRNGNEIIVDRKFDRGNAAMDAICPNAKKLDENGEVFRHAAISHAFKLALQQARVAKKMSQQALATAINVKATVINDYEAGNAIPSGPLISKLNKVLGVTLPKTK